MDDILKQICVQSNDHKLTDASNIPLWEYFNGMGGNVRHCVVWGPQLIFGQKAPTVAGTSCPGYTLE